MCLPGRIAQVESSVGENAYDGRQAFDEAIRADSNYADAYLMLAVLEQSVRNSKRLVSLTVT